MPRVPLHKRGLRIFLVAAALCLAGRAWLEPEKALADDPDFIRLRAPLIALEQVRVIDGTGTQPKENQIVLIKDGRIQAVGDVDKVPVPADAMRLGLPGHTVLPGLVMVHEHLLYTTDEVLSRPQPFSAPRLYLAAGVTTIRTAGSDFPYHDLNLKRSIDEGTVPGPKVHVTGPFFNGWEGHLPGDHVVEGEQDARRAVAYWASEGVTSFKAYETIPKAALKGMIDEAHAHGLMASIHPGSVTCQEAADLGIDSIEHGWVVCVKDFELAGVRTSSWVERSQNPQVRSMVQHLAKTAVVLVLTPAASSFNDLIVTDEELDLFHPTTREMYLRMMLRRERHEPDAEAMRKITEVTRLFQETGGQIVLGSDAGGCGLIAGYANHRALEFTVESGFTPLETIRMATLDGARFLGVENEVGSVAVGKAADLLVVNGDPSADIHDVRKVVMVFKDGVAYDPAQLRESVKGTVGWR